MPNLRTNVRRSVPLLLTLFSITACTSSESASSQNADSGGAAGGSVATTGAAAGIPTGSVVLASTSTPFERLAPGRYRFESAHAQGTCLFEYEETNVKGTPCEQESTTQLWKISVVADGVYRMESGASGHSLDVGGGATSVGSSIGTWYWSGGSEHREWRARDVGNGRIEFEPLHTSGVCLGLGASGAELVTCGTEAAQWLLTNATQSPLIGRGLNAAGCVTKPALGVTSLGTKSMAQLGALYDVNAKDKLGSDDWYANYGKRPEFPAIAVGTGIEVLMRDDADPHQGHIVHLEPSAGGLSVTSAWQVGLLGEVMGLARDENGIRYYATAVNEESALDADKSIIGKHRANIVRLVGFDETGCVRLEVDVDLARGFVDAASTLIINPMKAATARLVYGNGVLSLVHGLNTDANDSGTRHQISLNTMVSTANGEVVSTETMWVSHTMDERMIWDGSAFVELHLGDAYPRGLVMGRFTPNSHSDSYHFFEAKGSGNPTYTRLGGIAQIGTGDYGYLVAFSTERSGTVDKPRGSRDLALIRVVRNFDTHDADTDVIIDTNTPSQAIDSGAINHLVWLTNYEGMDSAERPRVVALNADQFVLTWEHWVDSKFEGTWSMVVNGSGSVVHAATRVGDDHIPRGDDAIRFGTEAATVLSTGGKLVVNLVDASLKTRRIVVP